MLHNIISKSNRHAGTQQESKSEFGPWLWVYSLRSFSVTSVAWVHLVILWQA